MRGGEGGEGRGGDIATSAHMTEYTVRLHY